MTGLFVTFEGGDGVGKSTQSTLLAEWLQMQGRETVITREPGGTELGVEIRNLVQHRRGHVAPRAEALLYAADRAHHIATLVRPALDRGAVVVQDRYLDSSVAYQGAGRTLGPDDVRELSLWAAEGLLPDVTFLLDLDPALGTERVRSRDVYDRLEAERLEFHERVRAAYRALAEAEPERITLIDASQSIDAIQEQIRARVSAALATLEP